MAAVWKHPSRETVDGIRSVEGSCRKLENLSVEGMPDREETALSQGPRRESVLVSALGVHQYLRGELGDDGLLPVAEEEQNIRYPIEGRRCCWG